MVVFDHILGWVTQELVHQGSALNSLHFIRVLEALSREFCTGVPWELLYADEQVIITDTQECIFNFKAQKADM